MTRFAEWRKALVSEARLRETIERLRQDGLLSGLEADRLLESLPTTMQESQYVLRHLGAHLAIGVVFAFDLVPLPLGTVSRALWVIGSRATEALRGKRELAAVHSVSVLAVSIVPFAGYFAYLIPLRSRSADAAFLLANHITYLRSDCSLHAWLEKKPHWMGRLIRAVVSSSPGESGTKPSEA